MKIVVCYTLAAALLCTFTSVWADEDQIIESSAKLIQDKLNEVGVVVFELLVRDTNNNTSSVLRKGQVFSNVAVNAKQCSITGDFHREDSNGVVDRKGSVLILKGMRIKDAIPVAQFASKINVDQGRPEITGIATNPENVFVVEFNLPKVGSWELYFKNLNSANQTVNALRYLIMTCDTQYATGIRLWGG
jgi:hypothetical protein